MNNPKPTPEKPEGDARVESSALLDERIRGLKYAGCKYHPDRLNLSCAKIRDAEGKPLTSAELWRTMCVISRENDALCDFINREMKMTADDPRIEALKRRMAEPSNAPELSHAGD